MIKRDSIAVLLVSIYIMTYLAVLQFDSTLQMAILMVLFFPVVLLSMIYIILKFGEYKGPELGDDEFGYQDRDKSKLGTF